MENILSVRHGAIKPKAIAYDLLAIAFIYFIPALSHLISLPVYLIEPMRLVVILSVIYFGTMNSYLIALTLPLFSYIISSHPSAVKSILISSELMLNIFLFVLLSKRIKNVFLVMFASIALSKIFYYSIKYILISSGALTGELVSTPLILQLVITIILSGYAFFILRKRD